MDSQEWDVIVAGAGPTGLALAGELALKHLRVLVLEARSHRSQESRALGVQARTMDMYDQRGLAGKFLELGHPVPQVQLRFNNGRSGRLDLTKLDTDFGHLLILAQSETERLLEERALELGVEIRRSSKVTSLQQDDSGVTVRCSGDGPQTVRTSWLVGCDGSKSTVRESIGVRFDGEPYPYTILVADVRLKKPPADDLQIQVGKLGLVVCTAFGDGYYRLGVIDRTVPWRDGEVEMTEIGRAVADIYGYDPGPHDPIWSSRFVIQEKQASAYRKGRVLLAGDAAHVHSPLGGQGLNLGVQDAYNLGWKLASVQRGEQSEDLLDTYVAERRRRSAAVIKATDLVTRLMMAGNPAVQLLRRSVVPAILSTERGRLVAAGALSGVTARYPARDKQQLGENEGRRVPNIRLRGADGDADLFELLHQAQFVLVDDGSVGSAADPWADRLCTFRGTAYREPDWSGRPLLVRPDGYLAGEGTDGVLQGLRRWCGRPSTNPTKH